MKKVNKPDREPDFIVNEYQFYWVEMIQWNNECKKWFHVYVTETELKWSEMDEDFYGARRYVNAVLDAVFMGYQSHVADTILLGE